VISTTLLGLLIQIMRMRKAVPLTALQEIYSDDRPHHRATLQLNEAQRAEYERSIKTFGGASAARRCSTTLKSSPPGHRCGPLTKSSLPLKLREVAILVGAA
jgi:hypothetical protein